MLEKLGFEKYLQDYLKKLGANTGCCSCSCSETKEAITIKSRVKDALIYAKNLFQKIWLFALLGVGVGAFLHGYVSQEFFIKYMSDNNFFAPPLAVIVGIPLYANATSKSDITPSKDYHVKFSPYQFLNNDEYNNLSDRKNELL